MLLLTPVHFTKKVGYRTVQIYQLLVGSVQDTKPSIYNCNTPITNNTKIPTISLVNKGQHEFIQDLLGNKYI